MTSLEEYEERDRDMQEFLFHLDNPSPEGVERINALMAKWPDWVSAAEEMYKAAHPDE